MSLSQAAARFRNLIRIIRDRYTTFAKPVLRQILNHWPASDFVVAWATVILAVFTVVLAMLAYWALQDTEKTVELSERAWLGSTDAKIDSVPKIGKASNFTITVRNTGRSPAIDVVSDVKSLVVTSEEIRSGSINTQISKYVDKCFSEQQPQKKRQVMFPSGSSPIGYELNMPIDKSLIDADVVSGKNSLVVRGCLAYQTFGSPHHSSFCFYYTAGKTPSTAHLGICQIGNEAD